MIGAGEPLLLLSGYAMPAATLATVSAMFAGHFTCITFDYPGSGRASAPLLPLTTPGLAASAVRLLDHLGLESAHVYGMSLGGLVAQELAIRFPERVRGLVLGATTPGGYQAARPARRAVVSGWTGIRSLDGAARDVRLSGALYQGCAAMLHDTSARLARIQAKTLVIHGELDTWVPVANAHLLHRGIWGSELEVLPGASHLYAFDDPAGTAAVVLHWFDRSAPFPVGRRTWLRRRLEPGDRALAVPVGSARAIWTTGRLTLASLRR